MAKNQGNAEQHSEAEPLLLENYSHSSTTLSSKNNRKHFKNKRKNKCDYTIDHNENEKGKWKIDHVDTT